MSLPTALSPAEGRAVAPESAGGETAFTFDCGGDALVGILHDPGQGHRRRRAIVVVVGGGPQYRVGGHRQLTLWSRALCAAGYPVLRFDYRGMGDAHGDFRGFTGVDDDIRAAVDALYERVPKIDEVVLWGECDAASAILLYAHLDARVRGVVLLNPWVRTEALQAQAILHHYYWQRLVQPSFWRKVLGGGFNPMTSLRSALALRRQARASGHPSTKAASPSTPGARGRISRELPLTEGMLEGLRRFEGRLMLVLSGRDLIAKEFLELLDRSPSWAATLRSKPVERHDVAEGDHTFSSAEQRNQVLGFGMNWLRSW